MQRDWLQLISNAAIIVGLIVVIFELKQSHDIARTISVRADYDAIQSNLHALMGENAAEVVAKARSAPSELTDGEKIIVDAHLLALYSQLESYEYSSDTGSLFGDDWVDVPPVYFNRNFNFAYAREWWLRERALEKPWTTDLDRMFDGLYEIESE